MSVKPAQDELEQLEYSSTKWLAKLLSEVAALRIAGAPEAQISRAELDLADALANAQSVADLLGRRRLALEAKALQKGRQFQVPKVPSQEAAESILERLSALVTPEDREIMAGWEAARDLYLKGRFALAKSVSLKATEDVRKTILRAVKTGTPQAEAERAIVEALRTGDPSVTVTASYAETVFRTNINSAYTAGRREQAKSPTFRKIVGAWKLTTAKDRAVRSNHAAAQGFIAATDDPIWNELAPPLGFNCRCVLSPVSAAKAKAAGVVDETGGSVYKSAPPGAGPDKGFKTLGARRSS